MTNYMNDGPTALQMFILTKYSKYNKSNYYFVVFFITRIYIIMTTKYHELFFYYALYLSYILYFIAYFQIHSYNPRYLKWLQDVIKYYVVIFLLIRFNPFSKPHFTEFDRTIVFSSALFLLTTTAFNKYAEDFHFIEVIKNIKIIK